MGTVGRFGTEVDEWVTYMERTTFNLTFAALMLSMGARPGVGGKRKALHYSGEELMLSWARGTVAEVRKNM